MEQPIKIRKAILGFALNVTRGLLALKPNKSFEDGRPGRAPVRRLKRWLTRGSINIDKLLSKRQHNVQEQNEILKNKIASEAIYWRQNGIPAPLENAFKSYQVDMSSSIVLDYEQDFPGICTDEGILLTSTGEFFKFEADLTPDRTKLIELYEFEDITNEFKITAHAKGTGATWGYLAIEALNEINCRFEKS